MQLSRLQHLTEQNQNILAQNRSITLPAIIGCSDEPTQRRFLEFFAASIRNRHTRAAYYRAVSKFFHYCEKMGVHELTKVDPLMIAAFIEEETHLHEPPTVKQELAAVRGLFDYLVVGQIIPFNPASSVKGPAYSIEVGKTPVIPKEEMRYLLESIPLTRSKNGEEIVDLVGLRDRALLGLMIYSFARVSAVIKMRVADYRPEGKRYFVLLHEKGGKFHRLPVHHNAEEYLDEYIEAAGIVDEKKTPLWRSAKGRTGRLTDRAISRQDVWGMIKRRAKAAGIETEIGCHSFRATGITAYLESGGTLENAQRIANHRSAKTTKLYDRRGQQVSLDEIERIRL